MSGNSLKTPLAATLPKFTRNQIDQSDQLDGMILPCHVVSVAGPIVTVAFDIQTEFTLPQVTMAILGSEYIRLPIQVGCKGIAISADAYLGAVTGLGGSTTPFLQPGNLGALAFIPIGNKNFSTVDGNAVVIYGPNGVVLRDQGADCVMTLTPAGIAVTGTNGDLSVSGNLSAGNGITCTFTTVTGQTVTVQNGIVTNLA